MRSSVRGEPHPPKKKTKNNPLILNGLTHRTGCSHIPHLVPRQLRSKLLIKCQLDPLDVVAQLDGRSQLQVHTLLHCWEVQQQQRLSVNLLPTHEFM